MDRRGAASLDQGAGAGGHHQSLHSGSPDGEGDGHRDRAQVTGAREAVRIPWSGADDSPGPGTTVVNIRNTPTAEER